MSAITAHSDDLGSGPSPRVTVRTRALACAVCFVAGVAAFWPTLRHPFVYDDHPIVSENWIVKAPDTWYRFLITSYWPPASPRERRPGGGDKLYRPMTIGSFRLEYRLHGGRPGALHAGETILHGLASYHGTNTILHGVTSVLVCVLALRVWGNTMAALIAGLLFAVHPIHADAVAPVVGRSEILAGLFSAWLLLRYAQPVSLTGAALGRFHVFSAVLFAAAVFSKEHALFIWPAILSLQWYQRRTEAAGARPPFTAWLGDLARRGHIGFAYVAAAFFFLRFFIFGMHYRRPPESLPFWANPLAREDLAACLLTPFRLLWLTARLFVDPSALSPLWNPDALLPARSLREADVWGGMFLAGLWIALIVWGCRRGRAVGIWALVFAWFMLLPLHVVPVASWLFAERWLYLPSVVLAVVVAGAVNRYGRQLALAGVCAAIVLLPQTWSYASAWRSDVSMNRYVLEAYPDNFHAANNLAWVYFVEKRYEDSLRVASELADRFPDAWEPYMCMSETYAAMGETQRAREARAEADSRRTAALLQLR